jgi:hypothetical protein
MAINDTVLAALARLEHDRDFGEVLKHLRELRLQTIDELVAASDLLRIGQLQGAAQVLGELLQRAETARATLTRIGM